MLMRFQSFSNIFSGLLQVSSVFQPVSCVEPQRLGPQAVLHMHLHEPIHQDGAHLPVDVMLQLLSDIVAYSAK